MPVPQEAPVRHLDCVILFVEWCLSTPWDFVFLQKCALKLLLDGRCITSWCGVSYKHGCLEVEHLAPAVNVVSGGRELRHRAHRRRVLRRTDSGCFEPVLDESVQVRQAREVHSQDVAMRRRERLRRRL